MGHQSSQIPILRQIILGEIFKDLNSPTGRWLRGFLQPIAWPSAHRFAKIAAKFDQYVEKSGFREAMRFIMHDFINDVDVWGVEHAPVEGPLLVVSNHPGTYDSIVITASLPREDVKIIVGDFSILKGLPFASKHLIFTDTSIQTRFGVVRSAIRHLRDGGALLIFPGGRVEPDPAVLPGAAEAMNAWSPSLDLILRSVPQTKVLITIVSDVLSPIFLNHPLIRYWRGMRNPQTVAEVIQILTQMVLPGKVKLKPKISFGIPLSVEELGAGDVASGFLESIINQARYLLAAHSLLQSRQI